MVNTSFLVEGRHDTLKKGRVFGGYGGIFQEAHLATKITQRPKTHRRPKVGEHLGAVLAGLRLWTSGRDGGLPPHGPGTRQAPTCRHEATKVARVTGTDHEFF